MTLKASDDGGATWREVDVLHPGPAAYSCLVLLPPKEGVPQVGCLYECGAEHPYERIAFAVRAVPAASPAPAEGR